MQTKEKSFKLIFFAFICCAFICLFSVWQETLAAIISGTVEDEVGSPIANVNVQGSLTNDSGIYKVDISRDSIEFEFQEEIEEAKAESVTYIPTTNKKYNIVIVKPENDCENEYKQINNIFANCSEKNEKIITYNNSGGYNDGITDPFTEFADMCGDNYSDNDYVNLFIVIATSDIPEIRAQRIVPPLENGHIFYDIDANMLPENMQRGSTLDIIIGRIREFGAIDKKIDELSTVINSKKVNLELEEDKNQIVELKVKMKKEIDIGGFITGQICLEDGSRAKITEHEYGNSLNKITVELINLDTGNIKFTEVQNNGKYGFERPVAGRYKLRFKYNGQEFKTIEKESDDVINVTDRNHIEREIDREGFNDRNNIINNEKAKKILKWDDENGGELINIFAETIEFEVKDDIEESGTPGDADYQEEYIDPPKCLNLVLEKRAEFEFKLINEINVVKVTLSDGQIFKENRMGEIRSQVQMRQIIMDEELMHGATIEIEYLIRAEGVDETNPDYLKNNNAEIKVKTYIDYINKNLNYNPDTELLDKIAGMQKNSDCWETTDDENILKLKTTLNSGNNYQAKLTVSKMIGSNLNDENLIWQNFAEVIEYSNTEGRRLKYNKPEEFNEKTEKDRNIPDNLQFDEAEREELKDVYDTAIAEDVFIIPPFGGENDVFINLNKYIKQKNNFLNKGDVPK